MRALAPLSAQVAAENGLVLVSKSPWTSCVHYKNTISRKLVRGQLVCVLWWVLPYSKAAFVVAWGLIWEVEIE